MQKKNVVLYGMGSWIENHYMWLLNNFHIYAVYDRDSNKAKKAKDMGLRFLSLAELNEQKYDIILITSTFVGEITHFLKEELKIDKQILVGNDLYAEYEAKFSNKKVMKMGNLHPKITFSVIQRGNQSGCAGLLGLYTAFIQEIKDCIDKRQVPIIDMKNYYTIYHDRIQDVGKVNTWELFFKQPYEEYSLEEVLQSSNVIFPNLRWEPWKKNSYSFCNLENVNKIINDYKYRKEMNDIFIQYTPLSDRVKKDYKFYRERYFQNHINNEKVLGVVIRGTDFVKGKPYMHYIQPSIEQIVEKIKYALKNWGITKIYVNSDEEENVNYIKRKFADITFSMDYQRFDSYNSGNNKAVGEIRFEREDDAYRRGADYLISTLFLAECDCFIAGVNSCSLATLIMSEGFEHEYIFQMGLYGVDDDAYICTPDGNPVYVNKRG